ncbi:MAG TPA: hypothetical protein VER96_29040 [Polyangiaceae bacterium]|nr:hypothetical protein [Polyangiaceae bacterium]
MSLAPRNAPLLISFVLLLAACKSRHSSSADAQPSASIGRQAPQSSQAPPPAISAEAPSGELKSVSSIQAVDRAVRDELERRIEEPMADVGEPFQATDVFMGDSPPPTRRFVLAAVLTRSPVVWVLCYEHGGIGYHYHIAVFTIEAGVATVQASEQWTPKRGTTVTLKSVVEALQNEPSPFDDHHW